MPFRPPGTGQSIHRSMPFRKRYSYWWFIWFSCKNTRKKVVVVVEPSLLLSLGCHPKPTGDESHLSLDIASFYAAHLPFPDHLHYFVSLQGLPRCFKRAKTQSWLDVSFDEAVILLDKGVELFDLPQFARGWNSVLCLQLALGLGIGGVLVDRDDPGGDRVSRVERL